MPYTSDLVSIVSFVSIVRNVRLVSFVSFDSKCTYHYRSDMGGGGGLCALLLLEPLTHTKKRMEKAPQAYKKEHGRRLVNTINWGQVRLDHNVRKS